MKRCFLLLSFSILLSGCATDYNAPAQPTQSYRDYPAVIEATEKQPTTYETADSPKLDKANQQIKEEIGGSNLSNSNSYINVDGNQVHSPAYADSVPAGASAVCRDGTYSFSQHRQGTCSGHGGVATWY